MTATGSEKEWSGSAPQSVEKEPRTAGAEGQFYERYVSNRALMGDAGSVEASLGRKNIFHFLPHFFLSRLLSRDLLPHSEREIEINRSTKAQKHRRN